MENNSKEPKTYKDNSIVEWLIKTINDGNDR